MDEDVEPMRLTEENLRRLAEKGENFLTQPTTPATSELKSGHNLHDKYQVENRSCDLTDSDESGIQTIANHYAKAMKSEFGKSNKFATALLMKRLYLSQRD